MSKVTAQIAWADNTADLARNIAKGLDTIELNTRRVNKLVADFGSGAIRQAHEFATAVDKVGGAAALTEAQQKRVNDIVTKALEKYQLLGEKAPQALKDLADATKKVEQPTSSLSNWMTSLGKEIGTVAAGFISAQAVIGTVRGGFDLILDTVKDSVKAYADAEAAQTKLTAALRQHGISTPEVIADYNNLATSFQQTTVFSDDLITKMEALLTQVGGVMPSKMKDALKASTDLAAGLGIDLESATTLVAKAAAGHTETLGRYGITVSDAALKTQGFDAVLEAVNRQFGGQAASQIETYAGKVEQLKNSWNNVEEAIGKFIVTDPIVARALSGIIEKAAALDQQATQSSHGVADLVFELTQSGELSAEVAGLEDYIDTLNTLEAQIKKTLAAGSPDMFKAHGPVPVAPSFTGDVGSFTGALVAGLNLSDTQRMALLTQDLSEKTGQLTTTERAAALASFAHGKSVEDTVKALELYWPGIEKAKGALEKLHKAYDDGIEKQKKYKEAADAIATVEQGQFEILGKLDAATVTRIQTLAKSGVDQGKLATFFHLTDVEIKAVIESGTILEKVMGLNNQTTLATGDALEKLGHKANDADSALIAMAGTLDKVAAIERGLPLNNLGELPGFKVDPKDDLKGIEASAKRVDDNFRALTDTLRSLGQTAGGTFGTLLSGLGSLIELFHQADKAASELRAKGAAATQADIDLANQTKRNFYAGLIATGATVAASGIDTSGKASRGSVIAHDALSGAAYGAAIGANPALASVSLGTSVGIGAATGAIVGWIRSGKEWRQIVHDISRDFGGIQVSDDFAKMIEDLEDQAGVGSAQAMTLVLDQLIQSVGGLTDSNLDLFTGKLRDVFVMLGRHELTAAQATQVLDKNFADFAKNATDATGRLNDQMREFISLNDQYGTHSKAIADYLKSQGITALGNLEGAFGGGVDEARLDAIKARVDAAQKAVDASKAAGTQDTTEGRAAQDELTAALTEQHDASVLVASKLVDLGTIAVATFAAAVASGQTFTQAILSAHPALDRLRKDYEDLGLNIDDAGVKALLFYDKVFGANPKTVTGLSSLTTIMTSLGNMGKGATSSEQFQAMERSGVNMINDLFNASKIAGGTDQDALRTALIGGQDFLHAAQKEAKSRGETLDPAIAEKIQQSKDLGLWVDEARSSTDRLLDKLDDILHVLQGLPLAIHDENPGSSDSPTTPTRPGPPDTQNPAPGPGDGPRPNPMAEGGFGHATGPLVFSTQGDEDFAFSGEGRRFLSPTLYSPEQYADLQRGRGGVIAPLNDRPIIVEVHQTVTLDGQVVERTVTRHQADHFITDSYARDTHINALGLA